MRIQHQKILDAATALNININDISSMMNCDAAILESNGKTELLLRGTPTSLLNIRSQYYCDNKQLTKKAFQKLNIASPKSVLFQTPKEKPLLDFFEPGKTYVCKPADGTNGIGVEMNIKSLETISNYWQKNRKLRNGFFMLEEQISGEDLRVQVIGGRIIAVCTRKPAFIVGDGKKTLKELIEDFQKVIKGQNPANKLLLDQTTFDLLAEQKISKTEIPKAGREIFLNKVSNMAQGAVAMDRTEDINPGFQVWIDKLVEYLETSYFALDIIAKDYRNPPNKEAWALEINARPEWLHHTFSKIKKHDIPKILLNSLFDLG